MNYNLEFVFHPIGKKVYETIITTDPLSGDIDENELVCVTMCDCGDHQMRRRECKHIIEAKNKMKLRGEKIRDDVMVRVFCPMCKVGKNLVQDNMEVYAVCGTCGQEMVIPKNGEREDTRRTSTST